MPDREESQPDWHEKYALDLHEATTKSIPEFSDRRLIVLMVIIPADNPGAVPAVVSNMNRDDLIPDLLAAAANSAAAALGQNRVVQKQATR